MNQEREIHGVWWRPGQDKEIFGTLNFVPAEGATLRLFGAFHEVGDVVKTAQPTGMVHGIASDGKHISLVGCLERESTFSTAGGFPLSVLSVDLILKGHHFDSDETRMARLAVRFDYLDEWIRVTGLDGAFSWTEYEAQIRFELPDPVLLFQDGAVKLSIEFRASIPTFRPHETSMSITQHAHLVVESMQGDLPYDELMRYVQKIRRLVSFALTRPIHATAMDGRLMVLQDSTSDSSRATTVEVFTRTLADPGRPRTLVPFDVLFFSSECSNGVEATVKAWLKNIDEVAPTYDLYSATMYEPRMFLQHRFLSLAQAVETYHRRQMDTPATPEVEHSVRMHRILASASDEDRTWLKGKLEYSNQRNLNSRIREIILCTPPLAAYFGQDTKKFARMITDTRNYLTHYNENLRAKAATGIGLFAATEKLRLILDVRFLHDLGFSAEDIRTIVNRNKLNSFRFGRV